MNSFRTVVYYLIYPLCRFAFFLVHPVFHVRGRENLPDGPYILCCNHSSGSDPFWVIFAARPKKLFRFLAKVEFSKMPVINVLMRAFGVIFVDRGHRDTAAIEKSQNGHLPGRSGNDLSGGHSRTAWNERPGKMRCHPALIGVQRAGCSNVSYEGKETVPSDLCDHRASLSSGAAGRNEKPGRNEGVGGGTFRRNL